MPILHPNRILIDKTLVTAEHLRMHMTRIVVLLNYHYYA